jgi:hypothetical protein
MTDHNLLHFITSYGAHYSHQMSEDLKRLQDQGKIELVGLMFG